MNNHDITITIRANSALFAAAMQEAANQTKSLDPQLKSAAGSVNELSKASDTATNKTSGLNGAFNTLNKTSTAVLGAIAGVAATLATKAIDSIATSVGNAINRVDTLNNSSKVFANLGFKTGDVDAAMTALNKSILGLPTSLNQAVTGMESLALQNGNIQVAQKEFAAMNDAVLSTGGSTAMLENAIQQVTQLDMNGPLDAQTWDSLRQSGLEPAMKAMANMSGVSMAQLKTQFGNGTLTVQDFMTKLMTLDTQGTGNMASLNKQAHDMTSGIGTGWANMQTAITRGIADVIQSIGSANISSAIAGIGKALEDALKDTAKLVNYIKSNGDIFKPIAAGLVALAAGFAILKLVAVTQDVIGVFNAFRQGKKVLQAYETSTKAAAAAQALFNAVMDASFIGIIIVAVAALVAGLIYFFTQTKTGKAIVQSVFKAIGGFISDVAKIASSVASAVSGFFKRAWNDIKGVWSAVSGFFKGIWDGVVAVFNAVVGFFKKWGITIVAVAFWPITLAVGAIIKFWQPITAFFSAVWQGIVAIFTPVVTFFTTVFQLAWAGIKLVWDGVVWYYTTIWNGIVAIFSVVSGWFTAVFSAAWNGIVAIWNVAPGFFSGIWQSIVAIFSPIIGWFAGVFSAAWEGIKAVFSSVGSFFRGVWGTVTSIFSSIGSSVANAVGSAIKGVVNSALSIAEGTINGFIGLINGAIHIMNKVPGVHIPNVGKLNLPRLASGGIVAASPGGQAITVAEGGQDEWVVPESKMASVVQQLAGAAARKNNTQSTPQQSSNEYNIQVSVTVQNDGTDFTDAQATSMGKKIANALRAQGLSINEMGALRG